MTLPDLPVPACPMADDHGTDSEEGDDSEEDRTRSISEGYRKEMSRRASIPERIIEALDTRPEGGRTPSGRLGSLSTPLGSDITCVSGVKTVGELVERRDFLLIACPTQAIVGLKLAQKSVVPDESRLSLTRWVRLNLRQVGCFQIPHGKS